MIKGKNIVCIIPARLNSTRFPEKLLKNINSKPILQWVWEAANKTTIFNDVVFAIDSEKTANVIKSFDGKYFMTSKFCQSGTDRIIEVMHSGKIKADIWVNWQADEPFIKSEMIYALLKTYDQDDADVWSLKKKILNKNEISSPNFVKVITNSNGYALYFSRSKIPYYRDKNNIQKIYYKHIGLYAYTTNALQKISQMHKCYLEDAERLEQLRFLFYGLKIKLNKTDQEVIGIDTPKDLEYAENFAKQNF